MERIPILKIGDILLVSIQVDLQDHIAVALQEDLAERIVSTGSHGVLIDISALEIVDSFIGRMISTIASVSRVLDAQSVVVGMRPAVAITLVELGLSLEGVRTALDVDRGMAMLQADLEQAIRVDHLDTHHHLGFLPVVGRSVEAVAKRHGIGAIRSEIETPTLSWVTLGLSQPCG